jgi:DNA-binding SARP family transcriptional activator
MVGHLPHFIRRFGSPMNFDTGTFETAHRTNVKDLFGLTNKSEDAAAQMMKHLSIIENISWEIDEYDRMQKKNRKNKVEDAEEEFNSDLESVDSDDEQPEVIVTKNPMIIFTKNGMSIENSQVPILQDLLDRSGLKTTENVSYLLG